VTVEANEFIAVFEMEEVQVECLTLPAINLSRSPAYTVQI
jgi:hypothetical protein